MVRGPGFQGAELRGRG